MNLKQMILGTALAMSMTACSRPICVTMSNSDNQKIGYECTLQEAVYSETYAHVSLEDQELCYTRKAIWQDYQEIAIDWDCNDKVDKRYVTKMDWRALSDDGLTFEPLPVDPA